MKLLLYSYFLIKDQWTDEEAFKDSGGVSGYIARAKNLMDTRKLYTEAIASVVINIHSMYLYVL